MSLLFFKYFFRWAGLHQIEYTSEHQWLKTSYVASDHFSFYVFVTPTYISGGYTVYITDRLYGVFSPTKETTQLLFDLSSYHLV